MTRLRALLPVVGVSALLAAAIVLSQLQIAHDRVGASTLRAAQIGSCRRVNVLRDAANQIARRQLALVELIITPRSKEYRLATGIRRAYLRGYLARLYRLRAEATYDPLTNCERAVNAPLTYVPPRPVRFVR